MSPKKQQRGRPLTAEEKAERSCSVCRVPVPGAYTWLDPATQQPCYGTAGEAERAVGSPRSKWAQEGQRPLATQAMTHGRIVCYEHSWTGVGRGSAHRSARPCSEPGCSEEVCGSHAWLNADGTPVYGTITESKSAAGLVVATSQAGKPYCWAHARAQRGQLAPPGGRPASRLALADAAAYRPGSDFFVRQQLCVCPPALPPIPPSTSTDCLKGVEKCSFDMGGGVTIAGWTFGRKPERPLLLFLHGFPECWCGPGQCLPKRPLLRSGTCKGCSAQLGAPSPRPSQQVLLAVPNGSLQGHLRGRGHRHARLWRLVQAAGAQ
jgi:hypothetical protein